MMLSAFRVVVWVYGPGVVLAAFLALVVWFMPACGGPSVTVEEAPELGWSDHEEPVIEGRVILLAEAGGSVLSAPWRAFVDLEVGDDTLNRLMTGAGFGLPGANRALLHVLWYWPFGERPQICLNISSFKLCWTIGTMARPSKGPAEQERPAGETKQNSTKVVLGLGLTLWRCESGGFPGPTGGAAFLPSLP